MVGAEGAFAVGEGLAVQVGGFLVLPEAIQGVGEVVADGEGVGVVGAESAFAVGKGTADQLGGSLVLAQAT
ncbi:hypothetical protein SUDANB135_00056 [Streptomyces sp. SudanB135_2055]